MQHGPDRSSRTCTSRRCRALTDVLLERRVAGIAYETITDRNGALPLLTPMSEVAGRMAVQVGASYLQRAYGGRGMLLCGVPGRTAGRRRHHRRRHRRYQLREDRARASAPASPSSRRARDRMRLLDDIFHGQVTTLASQPPQPRRRAAAAPTC